MDTLVDLLNQFIGHSILISLAISFFGGILASLSPCTYPLLPVIISYVGSRSVDSSNIISSKAKPFFMSISYMFGLSVVYSFLGMSAALSGKMFGNIATSPLSLFVVGNIIILLGLSILEVFPLPIFNPKINDPKKKGIGGSFLLGAISGLIASPCTAPILGVLLTYVATTQNIVLGGSLLFSFSLGFCLLLVLAGTFSGFLLSLPKPGNWMLILKKALGLAMIGLGEYFLIKCGQLWF